eukprot:SAG11_NODE_1_length_64905_cov_182.268355_50_plen_676_part_00
MSIHKSYLSKNNTIIANSSTNTGRNPVTQLFYGRNTIRCKNTGLTGDTCNDRTGFTPTANYGYSRFIFDLDLSDLRAKYTNCCMPLTSCTYTGVYDEAATFKFTFTSTGQTTNYMSLVDSVGLIVSYVNISANTATTINGSHISDGNGNLYTQFIWNSGTTLVDQAANFCQAVMGVSGHNGTIICTYNSAAQVTLTQANVGSSGNTTVYPGNISNLSINTGNFQLISDIVFSATTTPCSNEFCGGGIGTGFDTCGGQPYYSITYNPDVKHTLRMTNTSSFDDQLINGKVLVNDTRRATSFTLMLYKVPTSKVSLWDEGVGYDYEVPAVALEPEYNLTQSNRPSNWTHGTTLSTWPNPGTYSNLLPSSYTILATQSFDTGNEDISFSSVALDNEIGGQLVTPQTGLTYGIAFLPQFELLSGLTEAYSVGFFSRHTQTFFEPFLETSFNDYINDSRNHFEVGCPNRLFLYAYDCNGEPMCFDKQPVVKIKDCNDMVTSTLTATTLTCGAYYIDYTILPPLPQTPPVQYTDEWSNLFVGGVSQPNITNEFIVHTNGYTIGTTVMKPKIYGYSVSGIKEDEKIKAGDTRKIFVSTRVPYTVNQEVLVDNIQYRIYVKQGTTEVGVIPWSKINKTFTDNYFLLETSWMIPNEYYLDIKATSNQQVDTYSKVIKFQITNQL